MNATQDGPRIFLFGNRGYMSVVLSELVRGGWRVVGICASEPPALLERCRGQLGRLTRRLGLRNDTDFHFADPFEALPEPKAIARANGIPFFPASDLKTEAFRRAVSGSAPDIILVAGFHRLIPPEIFGLAKTAAINLHPSLLPRHRGGTPSRWVVRLGETRHGLTAHWLDRDFDTGDILLQAEVPVAPDDCWGDVEQMLLALLPSFLSQILSRVVGSAPPRQAQDEALATYEKSFKGKHIEIDWRRSPDEIRRTCLAIRPKSAGRTRIGGKPVCIWDVAGTVAPRHGGRPGEIIDFDADGHPIVRCGDSEAVTLITTLRNGVIRPAAEMATRLGLKVGDHFSSAG